jgi:hypothetical protein
MAAGRAMIRPGQICYRQTRACHAAVPDLQLTAPPLASAIVDRAAASSSDRPRAVSLSCVPVARVAQRGRTQHRRAAPVHRALTDSQIARIEPDHSEGEEM